MSSSNNAGSKTAQVLDAIQAGHRTLKAIANATELPYRAVNAMVYALEKQDRVIADSYDKERRNQEFAVLQYELSCTRGVGPRLHPTKRSMPAVLAAAADAAAEAIQCLTASMAAMVRTARQATTASVSVPEANDSNRCRPRAMGCRLTRMVRRAKHLVYLAGARVTRKLRLPAADVLKAIRMKAAASAATSVPTSHAARPACPARASLARGVRLGGTDVRPQEHRAKHSVYLAGAWVARKLRLPAADVLKAIRMMAAASAATSVPASPPARPTRASLARGVRRGDTDVRPQEPSNNRPFRSLRPTQPPQLAHPAQIVPTWFRCRKREPSLRLRLHAFSAASPPVPCSSTTAPRWHSCPGADFHF